MNCYFVFANAFLTRMFLYHIKHVVNLPIDTIVLLKENHRTDESFAMTDGIKIILKDTVQECIKGITGVFIIDDGTLPIVSINSVIQLADANECPIYSLRYRLQDDIIEDPKQIIERDDWLTNVPVVLHISMSYLSQSYCLENLLNKVFTNEGLRVRHFFTDSTLDMLKQLKDQDILNPLLWESVDIQQRPDVLIISTSCPKGRSGMMNMSKIIRILQPDYIVIQTDNAFDNIEQLVGYVRYGGGASLDMCVQSRYRITQGKYRVYNHDFDKKGEAKDLESPTLEKDLKMDVFSRLSLPDGMVCI